ncbi:hypothetical protein ACH5RR_031263 [Cinchona calisaya]|uniref:glucose-1-phosphate adenylyltransferase n=1 Tax=Cinchona calisaya TaxID=153742 RepID=A0ABD2YEQ4_9GENT
MTVVADGRIAILAAGQIHGTVALPGKRNWSIVKISNGDLMGEAQSKGPGNGERDPRTVVAIMLGGRAGTSLFPLTKHRANSAVLIGGAYRLIDVPMSNCIKSGINKVYIFTQFNSASLNRHLAKAYNFGNGLDFGDGHIEDQRSKEIEDVLILSGDHLYRMDYLDFVQPNVIKISNNNKYLGTVLGLSRDEAEKKPYIASMGVYVFKKDILLNLLRCISRPPPFIVN